MATQKELTQEVHQAVLGVKGTDDKGMVGDLKELKEEFRGGLSKHNARIRRLEITVASILIATGGGYGLAKLLGG